MTRHNRASHVDLPDYVLVDLTHGLTARAACRKVDLYNRTVATTLILARRHISAIHYRQSQHGRCKRIVSARSVYETDTEPWR